MATWPSTLPCPRINGYKIAPVNQTVRTDMEVGYARQRRRTGARADIVEAQWLFTDAQLDTFRTWFESDTDAQGGAAWFTIALKVGNTGETSVSARFTSPPEIALVPATELWTVTARLEVLE